MTIKFEQRNSSYNPEIVIEDTNVKMVIDIGEYLSVKDIDGKIKFFAGSYDVSDEHMKQFTRLMEDISESRHREFDSSRLIKSLFNNLSPEVADELVKKLHAEYALEIEEE